MVKKAFEYIGIMVILGIAVGTAVFIIYWPILEILGLSSIREYLDSIGGSALIAGGISGPVAVWFMKEKTDLFS